MSSKVKNTIYVIFSNVITFILGTLIYLIVPKVLDYDNYAIYKLYLFYLAYVIIFHFGTTDGFSILFGNYSKEDLGKTEIRSLFWVYSLFQLLVGSILFGLNLLFGNNIVFFYVILTLIISNINGLFTKFFTVNLRFKVFSILNILNKLSTFVIALVLLLLDLNDYSWLIYGNIIFNILLLLYSLFYYRLEMFGKISLKEGIKLQLKTIRYGFPMTLSYFLSTLIMGLDRFFIENNNTSEEFSHYSFAYNMIALFTAVMAGVNMLIYPYLKRANENTYGKTYNIMGKIINIFFGFSAVFMWVIPLLVYLVLPKYAGSIRTFYFIFPVVLFSAMYNMKVWPMVNALKEELWFTIINFIGLGISISLNFVVLLNHLDYTYYGLMTSISTLVWIIMCDIMMMKRLKVKIIRELVFATILTTLICCYNMFSYDYLVNIIFSALALLITLLFYYRYIKMLLMGVLHKKTSDLPEEFWKERCNNDN